MRYVLIILAFFIVSTIATPVFSRETGVLFLWEISSGRKAWENFGDEKFQQKFIGSISNGKPNGKGSLSHPDGKNVKGVWKDGQELNTKHFDKSGKVIGGFVKGRFIEGSNLRIKTVLYLRKVNGKWGWYDDGNIAKDYKYEGTIENGKPNGRGIYSLPNGNQYIGEFKDGKKSGHGTYTYKNGDKYIGKWKDGKKSAQGTFLYASGSRFEGEFKDGKKHGRGTLISKNGDKHVGNWIKGKKSGLGKINYASGSIFEGQFKNDKKHGEGNFTWKSGAKRVGEFRINKLWDITEFDKKGNIIKKWVSGVKVVDKKKEKILFLRNDNGKWIWDKNGNKQNDGKYVGSLDKNGIPNGAGVITFPDGKKYEGEWKNSKKHGKGTFTWQDGKKYFGEWINGEKHGNGTYLWTSGNKYEGEFKHDKRTGFGKYIWSNGDKYTGQWMNGKKNGQGTITFPDGKKYQGKWKNSKKHGKGTFTFPDGGRLTGEFRNDKPWNIKEYDKNDKIKGKFINGIRQ